MKIQVIKPSFEIVSRTVGMIKHIELCGRVCYKSEDKITESSAKNFVSKLIKAGHESVLEHANITVKIICDRSCSHQLVRHRLASYCLAGETVVPSIGTKKWTIEQLYNWSKDIKRKGRLNLIRLRSVDENGLLTENRIGSVIYNGKQEVYKIKTLFGRTIRATAGHRFLTPGGYKRLSSLSIGDKVFANGLKAYENEEWIKEQYLVQNKTRKQVATLAGISDSFMGKQIAKFGLQKDKKYYPNRKPGHGVKGMFSDIMLKKMSEDHLGEKNHNYKDSKITNSGGYIRCQKRYNLPDVCQGCGSNNTKIERHHIDKDPTNNVKSNIMFLCQKCHKHWHVGQGVKSVFSDTIISIELDGITDTYDISMFGPNHNFVANGFLVHNSQESQRYCNYSKKGYQVICPPSIGIGINDYYFHDLDIYTDAEHTKRPNLYDLQLNWLADTFISCDTYEYLLAKNIKPEDARSVLPNATKTELIVTANVRQWRHIFRERAFNPHAQWQIKTIMQDLHHRLMQLVPVLFEDLC